MPSRKRERQLARTRYERRRERAARAQARRRARLRLGAIILTVAVVLGGVTAIGLALGGSPKPSRNATSATGSPATAATGAGTCRYTRTAGPDTTFVGLPPPTPDRTAGQVAAIHTNRGTIAVALDTAASPCTTNSFAFLARKGFFNHTSCHRLTTAADGIYVLQCGDPSSTGLGGPGYEFGLEHVPSDAVYPAGTVAMARAASPGSNGSQFFIVYRTTSLPAPGYTILGQVTSGLSVVTTVAAAGVNPAHPPAPKLPVVISSVTVTPGGSS
ncbi:MAG: peptidylprolyl isomerase [Actinomycetes bacterium]